MLKNQNSKQNSWMLFFSLAIGLVGFNSIQNQKKTIKTAAKTLLSADKISKKSKKLKMLLNFEFQSIHIGN